MLFRQTIWKPAAQHVRYYYNAGNLEDLPASKCRAYPKRMDPVRFVILRIVRYILESVVRARKDMKNITCPQCRQPSAECKYLGDVGGVEFYDLYRLRCIACGQHFDETVYGGSPIASDWFTACPFCGIPVNEHEKYCHKRADTDPRDTSDVDRLTRWAAEGDADSVRSSLDSGAHPDTSDGYQTILMLAAQHGQTKVANVILEHGANPNLRTWDGWSALMIAVSHGHAGVIRLLIDAGANIEYMDGHGESALTLAISAGYQDIASILDNEPEGD
jgi:hypothetical protein